MVTRLRTLTKKSLFKFGRYFDKTVGELLIVKAEYIIWVYYNMDKVTFEPGIIKRLNIKEIDKPGKLPWLGREVRLSYEDTLSTKDIKRRVRDSKKASIERLKAINIDPRFTKGSLRRKNHGH